ncbi:MAG: hypothetical protein NC187_00535 [Candidatus Amulumruptor caecigallinarius]|nr:hypothetical protein [Candidatus Amulumruptor caecigallinarius]MCM1395963.1 hypothetical protein [Candidatus Amulumruptor caecigallinarius]MCM1452998.1 hypothetical protein [bacterium]
MKLRYSFFVALAALCVPATSCVGKPARAVARDTARKNIEFTVDPDAKIGAVGVPDSIFDGVLFGPKDQDFIIRVMMSSSSSILDALNEESAAENPDLGRLTSASSGFYTIAQELMTQSSMPDRVRPHKFSGWRVKVNYSLVANGRETTLERWCYVDPSGTSVVRFFDIPIENLLNEDE